MISYRLRATPQRRKCFSIFLAYSPVAHSFRLSSCYPPQYRIFGYFLSRGELYFRQYSLLASFTRFCACGAETALDDIALSITRIDKRKEEGKAHLQLLQKKKKKKGHTIPLSAKPVISSSYFEENTIHFPLSATKAHLLSGTLSC